MLIKICVLLILMAGLVILPAAEARADDEGRWLALSEIQDAPGVYVKRHGLFLPLTSCAGGLRFGRELDGFAVSIDTERFYLYSDDALVYVGMTLPRLASAAMEGYVAILPDGEYTHIDRREISPNLDYTIFGYPPPDAFALGERNQVFAFGRWVGTRFEETFAAANTEVYHTVEITPQLGRTFDGYFYLEFSRDGVSHLLVEHYDVLAMLEIGRTAAPLPFNADGAEPAGADDLESFLGDSEEIQEAEETLMRAYSTLFDLILALEFFERIVDNGPEIIDAVQRSAANAGAAITTAQMALIETTLRARAEEGLGIDAAADPRAAYTAASEHRLEVEEILDNLFGEARDVMSNVGALEFLSNLGIADDSEILRAFGLDDEIEDAHSYEGLLWDYVLKYYRAVMAEVTARQAYNEQTRGALQPPLHEDEVPEGELPEGELPEDEVPEDEDEAPPLQEDEAAVGLSVLHIVVFGDTLWSIAEQYLGSPQRWREIMEFNQLPTQVIRPGQILLIPRD